MKSNDSVLHLSFYRGKDNFLRKIKGASSINAGWLLQLKM